MGNGKVGGEMGGEVSRGKRKGREERRGDGGKERGPPNVRNPEKYPDLRHRWLAKCWCKLRGAMPI